MINISMNYKRNISALLLTVSLILIIVCVFALLTPKNYPLRIEASSSKTSDSWHVYVDYGGGYYGNGIKKWVGTKKIDLNFNLSSINEDLINARNIRINPGEGDGIVKIKSISFFDIKWEKNDLLKIIKPLHGIKRIFMENDRAVLETGDGPYFSLDFNLHETMIAKCKNIDPSIFAIALIILAPITFILCLKMMKQKIGSIINAVHVGNLYADYLLNNMNIITLSIILTIISIIVYWKFLTFNSFYVFANPDIASDTYNAFLPFMTNAASYLRTDGIPKWSFNIGLGQDIFFDFNIFNPFNWLPLYAGGEYLPYVLGYLQVLKIIIAGIIFYIYLRTMDVSKYASVLFSICYAFCGHMIVRGQWYSYSTEVVIAAFLLLSFELFYKKSKWFYLPLAVFGIILCMGSFYLWIYTFLLTGYSVLRYFSENNFRIKDVLAFFTKLGGLYILGVLLSSFFFMPDAHNLLSSTRALEVTAGFINNLIRSSFFAFNDYLTNISEIFKFFSNTIFGINGARSCGNYLEAPIFYCGVCILLIIPQFFIIANIRKKVVYLGMILLCLIYLIFPYFRWLLNGFSGCYFKISSFWITIVLLYIAAATMDNIIKNKVNIKLLFYTLLFLIMILLYGCFEGGDIDGRILGMAILLLIIYSAILYLLKYNKLINIAIILLLLVTCVEITVFSYDSVNRDRIMLSKDTNGYYDNTYYFLDYIKSSDKGFYRFTKSFYSVFANDGAAQNYYGVAIYHSFVKREYLTFMDAMGMPAVMCEHIIMPQLGDRFFLYSLLGIKYYLTTEDQKFKFEGFKCVKSLENYQLFKNNYSLPLGFTYDAYIKKEDFLKLSNEKKDKCLLNAFVLEDESGVDLSQYSIFHVNKLNNIVYANCISNLKQEYFNMLSFKQNHIIGDIRLKKDKLLFFSILFDNGWDIIVDGKKVKPLLVNIGFIGVPLQKGYHKIELIYNTPYFNLGICMSLLATLFYIFLLLLFGFRERRNSKKQFKSL